MKEYGFSLIELLVSISIMGILASIGVAGFQSMSKGGRDALRKSDLESIRSALEMYRSENGQYPATSSTCVANLSSSYINPYPSDPKNPTYRYCYQQLTTLTYRLCAHLENGASGDTGCGSANACTGSCNYQVVNP